MAHIQFGPGPAKVSSYAKIAATPIPAAVYNTKAASDARDGTVGGLSDKTQHNMTHDSKGGSNASNTEVVHAAIASIPLSLQKLGLEDGHTESTNSEVNADSGDSYEEDQSQVSSSSLNKPQSFDTKSLASVTTFAMDDKESIRPDDSASVRAADDEHTQPALSRNSSFQHDFEPVAQRTSRVFPSNITIPGRRFPTLANFPRFGNLPISPVLESQDVQMPKPPPPIIDPDDPREPSTVVTSPPDEKLMDALTSMKDRLPLLQLEEHVLSFLTSSASPFLELPPQNSFSRLLTHKLADYYGLPHAVNEDNTSVRIFRSHPRAAPPSLAQLARSIPIGAQAGPAAAVVKIMRREQLANRSFSAGNSSAPSSSVASKTTSENGFEGPSDDGQTSPAESTPNRDRSKLTREEREAHYNAARERIFGDMSGGDMALVDDQAVSMSRSSSSSGKKKTRRNKTRDDSFEARSAFALTYAPLHSQYGGGCMEIPTSTNFPVSPSSYDHSMYGSTPTQNFASFDPNMQYSNTQGFGPNTMQQSNQNEWQAMQNLQMHDSYMMYQQALQYQQSQAMQMQSMAHLQNQPQDWYQSQHQGFMNPTYPSTPTGATQQHFAEPQFQMPSEQYNQQYPRGVPNQNIYGNQYHTRNVNKSLFNPQTRSFIPNNGEGRNNRSNRHKGGRHGSNNGGHSQSLSAGNNSMGREDSLKLRYGTPANLPKKPPAPADEKSSAESSQLQAIAKEPVEN